MLVRATSNRTSTNARTTATSAARPMVHRRVVSLPVPAGPASSDRRSTTGVILALGAISTIDPWREATVRGSRPEVTPGHSTADRPADPPPTPSRRSLVGAFILVVVVALVFIVATFVRNPLDSSVTSDDGAYALEVDSLLDGNGWSVPHVLADVDPDGAGVPLCQQQGDG